MLKMNPLDSFEFTKPQLWPEWKLLFEGYIIYSMGKQAEHIYKSFTDIKEGKDYYETILAQFEDQVLQEVVKLVLNGWPTYQTQVPEEARSFFAYRGELSYSEGKLLHRDQMVIPALMREVFLKL